MEIEGTEMNKEKIEEIAKSVEDITSAFKQFQSVMGGGPADYYFERIMGYYEGCIKAAKFKIGDRVELKDTVTDGWNGRNHFMTAGAKATIMDVDYYKGKYRYDIMFDKETWIKDWEPDKGEYDVVDKHVFCFGQKLLRRVK